MCGFAGVVVWDEKFRVSRETLQKMSARVAHRGPDGQGLYLSPDARISATRPQVGLVHRRLAILDLDPRANQPFTDQYGRWIVFNGEIYNFRELRSELVNLKPDYIWRTSCDTEVLLLAYDAWGVKCVEHLNGMFAFAVWDEPAGSLFLARDRMGQKPLFYAPLRVPGAVAFASELSALRCIPWFDGHLDEEALVDYLNLGYYGGEKTIYGGIFEQLPSTFLIRRAEGGQQTQYFQQNPNRRAIASSPHQVRGLVLQAVQRQLVSDVPLGCFLSGGVDSSVIAASMRLSCGSSQRVSTFSIGFDDSRYDERGSARSVASYLGTDHHEFLVRPDAVHDLPRLAESFGQPFADSSALPTHYLSRETRSVVKVALSGDGGDELFGGYDRYRAMAWAKRLRRLPGAVRWGARRAGSMLPGSHPKARLARARRFSQSFDLPPAQRYARYVELFSYPLIDELRGRPLSSEVWADDYEKLDMTYGSFLKDRDEVQAALATDRVTYLPGDLLTKVDRASMLHALEVRSPFMDHELVQFAAGLTTDQLLKGGPKRMLREAFAQDLPAWVFKRKKMGFSVPIGEWFRGELRAMLHDHLFAADSFASQHFNRAVLERLVQEHELERVDHSQRLYALLMLELWWKTTCNLHTG